MGNGDLIRLLFVSASSFSHHVKLRQQSILFNPLQIMPQQMEEEEEEGLGHIVNQFKTHRQRDQVEEEVGRSFHMDTHAARRHW